jgi:hypothetical protein
MRKKVVTPHVNKSPNSLTASKIDVSLRWQAAIPLAYRA